MSTNCKINLNKDIKYNEHSKTYHITKIVEKLKLNDKTHIYISSLLGQNKLGKKKPNEIPFLKNNIPEYNFVVSMNEILCNKLKSYKKSDSERKKELKRLIDELKNFEEKMETSKDYNENKIINELKKLINKIEQFYLKTRRKKNSTRDDFYRQLEKLYKCQKNNTSKYAKRLRKLLLNKKLSYSNFGQIFSPRSKKRKKEVENFLGIESNNEITNKFKEIENFYKNSKKKTNKNNFEKLKKEYNKFFNKKYPENYLQINNTKTQVKRQEQSKTANISNEKSNNSLKKNWNNGQETSKKRKEITNLLQVNQKTPEINQSDINNLIKKLNNIIKNGRMLSQSKQSPEKKDIRNKFLDELKKQVTKLENNNRNIFRIVMSDINNLIEDYKSKRGYKWTNKKISNEMKEVTSLLSKYVKANTLLQTRKEKKEEERINKLIATLNNYIRTSRITIKPREQGQKKKNARNELLKYLQIQVNLLKKYQNFELENANIRSDSIIEEIKSLFNKYKNTRTWVNSPNVYKQEGIINGLLYGNPEHGNCNYHDGIYKCICNEGWEGFNCNERSTNQSGGNKYVNIKGAGRRKIRYYKNGKKYVIVKGRKISL